MNRRGLLRLSVISMLLLFPKFSSAQQWSGVLASSRAINWSQVGAVPGSPGALPDASGWTQCTTTACKTVSSGTTVTIASINAAISSASSQQYIQLPAGTFRGLSGTITLKNQTVVRGMGANSTFLVFTGQSGCNGEYAQFSLCGSTNYVGGEQNHATWTAGFSQGATSITLSNSSNITAGKTWIVLDQQDEAADTGNIWNCMLAACGSFGGGFVRTDDTCSSSVSPNVGWCSQEQSVLVTACSPSCNNSGSTVLTISPPLAMNNWRSSQSTGAWWATSTGYQMGVEDLSADLTNTQAGTSTVVMMSCYECWVSGIRSIDAARNHVYLYGCNQCTVEFSYLYQSTAHEAVSYSVELTSGTSNSLVLSNICQQVTDSCPSNTGGGVGNVAAYNFSIDDVFGSTGWFQPSDYDHASGHDFWLREGESTAGFSSDLIHGTHHFSTFFRNAARGWASSGCGGAGQTSCISNTTPMNFFGGSRYFNVVGNVLGQAGYDTVYNTLGTSGSLSGGSNQNLSVYYIGAANGQQGNASFCANAACSSHVTTSDPLGVNSIMRWGNYDVVTGAVRWSTSEVPSAFGDTTGTPSIYVNPVPPSQTLPNSFFLPGTTTTTTSSPCGTGLAWWKNPTRGTCEPFPPIGPDVTNGDYGQCASGAYAGNVCRVGSTQCGSGSSCTQAMGGHANLNPAHSCYLDVMSGPPDGSGSVLTYNRASCYANDPSGDPPPSAPTGLTAIVH
jgi:hypothetical protein